MVLAHCTAVRVLDETISDELMTAVAVVNGVTRISLSMGSFGNVWQFNLAAELADPPLGRYQPALIRPKGGRSRLAPASASDIAVQNIGPSQKTKPIQIKPRKLAPLIHKVVNLNKRANFHRHRLHTGTPTLM
jgi:hypothetical protein